MREKECKGVRNERKGQGEREGGNKGEKEATMKKVRERGKKQGRNGKTGM